MKTKGTVILAIGILLLLIGALLSVFPFVGVSKVGSESYQVQKSTLLVDQLGPMLPVVNPYGTGWEDDFFTSYGGELLNIRINVTSGDRINFTVYRASTTYLSFQNVMVVDTDWIVPENSTSSYNFKFCTSGAFSVRDVHLQVLKLWNETDFSGVTQKVPLLPFQALYVGLGTILSGILIMVSWHRHRKNSQLKG